jgi:hypothetical protein
MSQIFSSLKEVDDIVDHYFLYPNLIYSSIFQAEIWNIDLVTKEHGNGPLKVDDIDYGLIRIVSHTQV